MSKQDYDGYGYYIDPPSEVDWEVYAALGIPYVGGVKSFSCNPSAAILGDYSGNYSPVEHELPLGVALTCRELALKPAVIACLCTGLIGRIHLENSEDEFDIYARLEKAEKIHGKLANLLFPSDGISGKCSLPTDENGSFVGWLKKNAPLDLDCFFPMKGEDEVIAFARTQATAYFSWLTSHHVRDSAWKLKPPTRIVIQTGGGKVREVFDWRVPQDKIVLNCLNVTLQAIVKFQVNSHAYMAKRNIFTAMEQVKSFLAQGYRWVQSLDMRKAFPSMNRKQVRKAIRGILSAMMKKVPYFPKGLPNKKQRLADVFEMVDNVLNVEYATDKRTGAKIYVGDQGLLQGSSLSGVFFNMCMDRLDRKFLPGGEVVYVRFADNIIVLAKTENAAKEGFQKIRSYLANYGAEVRCEHGLVNLAKSPVPVGFVGINFHFDKEVKPTAKLAPSRIRRMAVRIVALGSIERMKKGVFAVFQFYARGGLLNDRAVKEFANALKVAAKAGSNGAGAGGGFRRSAFGEKALLALKDSIVGTLSGNVGGGNVEKDIEDILDELKDVS